MRETVPSLQATDNEAGTGGSPARECDVLIAGAGMAGLAAGRSLARAGLRVICVEPDPFPRQRVGESLDWSSPALLAELGLPVERLVEDGLGTWKRELRGIVRELPLMVGRPPSWVARWPLRFTATTVHVNRSAFDQALFEVAREAGVGFVWDRIETVIVAGDRVVGCSTRSGKQLSCRWFLDASGRARLLARSLAIGRRHYGGPRIALWAQVTAPIEAEATTLFFSDDRDELSWIWQIPIEKGRRSIGVVMPLDDFRELRRAGSEPNEILLRELRRFPELQDLPGGRSNGTESRSFHSYVADRTVGSNWFLVGEAAAFIDPLTSLGVTAALRNGLEAAALVAQSHSSGAAKPSDLADYDRRTRGVATLYNAAINDLLYSSALRETVGFRWAARAYVVLGYLSNSLYSKIVRPGKLRTTGVLTLVATFRLWMGAWLAMARLARRRGAHLNPS